MIALRGAFEQEEEGKWKWKGRWAFGNAVPNPIPEQKPPVAWPFQYKFDRVVAPQDVELPSLPQPEEGKDGIDVKEGDEVKMDGGTANEKQTGLEEGPKHAGPDVPAPACEPSQQEAAPGPQEGGASAAPVAGQKTSNTINMELPGTQESKGEDAGGEISKAEQDKPNGEQTVAETEPKKDAPKPPPQPKPTFADKTNPDDPDFTDACSKDDKLPPSGAWEGYFEAATGRKGPNMRIHESFVLFLNATPAPDARTHFPDDDAVDKDRLPANHIHARGMGKNQYGIFELVGSFHDGVLQMQRIYVVTPESKRQKSGRGRGRPPLSPDSKNRPTRKRQLSWKRRAAYEDEDAVSAAPTERRPRGPPRGRKRLRVDVDASDYVVMPQPSPTVGGAGRTTPTSVSTGVTTKAVAPRKRGTGQRNGGGGGGSNTGPMKLPAAGDPRKARYRSAHFLYYQRPEVVGDGDADGRVTQQQQLQQPKYVVYEGEMMNAQRDGRGLCLYSNGMLYEGEWKNDKEHGIGKLMSADRKRVIYKGEFEKGRIHGQGVYYYHHIQNAAVGHLQLKSQPEKNGTAIGNETQCRYEGEFKESLRHGDGVYYLSDGSLYNGSFQNNTFSGKGVFRWPDGSVYDGEWKNGKRHGLGVLKTADGFEYDGMWVANAMEGRGSAKYPGGQEYNGMFSQGRREGRGTIIFTNGAAYEGRFRDDAIDGQGTMKMERTMVVPRTQSQEQLNEENDEDENVSRGSEGETDKLDFMIPLSFQSDMGHIHQKAGFTHTGK